MGCLNGIGNCQLLTDSWEPTRSAFHNDPILLCPYAYVKCVFYLEARQFPLTCWLPGYGFV
jgi:hypothetical protein